MSCLMAQPVLVLNASYEALRFAEARDAIKLLVKGKAKTEVELDIFVHEDMPMPSIVRLLDYRRVPRQNVQPSRKNIYLRDRFRCQYCDKRLKSAELTLDHVIPKAQGGPDTWENLVACCMSCNRFKADRTPEQAGMVLLRKPGKLTIHTSRHMMQLMGSEDPEWRKYLYCN